MKEKKEAYDTEQERIKQEEETKKQSKITTRIQTLARYGITYDTLEHGMMSEGDFDTLIATKKQEFEKAEEARLEKLEEERVAREKLEADQQRFREEQEEFNREKKALEDEKNAIEKSRIDKENEEKRKLELAEIQLFLKRLV